MTSPTKHIIRERAYARAGLVGNPSDGYFGKTLAFTFADFYAEVVMYPSPHLELLPGQRDRSIYSDLNSVVQSIQDYGYYGGIRLLQASLKRFLEHCKTHDIDLHDQNFSMRYFTNIPSHVGLAGSSAIITACIRALMEFYGVAIPRAPLANLILSVETDELGISAGLQDRVAQVYQGLTYMDFDKKLMEQRGYGRYESLEPAMLKNAYVAYKPRLREESEVVHNDLRDRYESGETRVMNAMTEWAALAEQVRQLLQQGKSMEIGPLLDANFDLRRSLCRIHPDNIDMVEAARSLGASAKFTGSGGAIIGQYKNHRMYKNLVTTLSSDGIHIFKPNVL